MRLRGDYAVNPSQVKQLLPLLVAFAEGKELQFRINNGNWYPCTCSPDLELNRSKHHLLCIEYRAKPSIEVVRYRRCILNRVYPYVVTATQPSEVEHYEEHPGFIRWIDDDWQEVGV
jgi:hypothetical protein